VVIFGSGGVGINAVQGAAYAGARHVVVVDPEPFKRQKAEEFGATHTFATAEEAHEFVNEVTWGKLADHALVIPGVVTAEIVTAAVMITGKGGEITITGVGESGKNQLELPVAGTMLGFARTIRGTLFGACNPLYDVPRLLGLWKDGQLKLEELISNRYRLEEVNQGYEDMMAGKNIRGVIIHDD
jgi:alcohol dehydrogenase (nicotinoprotein)